MAWGRITGGPDGGVRVIPAGAGSRGAGRGYPRDPGGGGITGGRTGGVRVIPAGVIVPAGIDRIVLRESDATWPEKVSR